MIFWFWTILLVGIPIVFIYFLMNKTLEAAADGSTIAILAVIAYIIIFSLKNCGGA